MVDAGSGDTHPNDFRKVLRAIDYWLPGLSVKSMTVTAQPVSPANGDTYILPATHTGSAWGSASTNQVACYSTRMTTTSGGVDTTVSGWEFYTPHIGWKLYDQETGVSCVFDGSAWVNAIVIGATPIHITDTTPSTSPSTGALVVDGGVGVGLEIHAGGNIVAGNGTAANISMDVNNASAQNRYFRAQSAGVTRWAFGADAVAESGSDAGSNYILRAYTDAGVGIDNPISIVRAAGGSITIARPTSITGNTTISKTNAEFKLGDGTGYANQFIRGAAGSNRLITFRTGLSSDRWLFGADAVAETGSDAGSNFILSAYTDAGAFIDTPLSIIRAAGGLVTIPRPVALTNTTASTSPTTGAVTVGGGLGVGGTIHAQGNIIAHGSLQCRKDSGGLEISLISIAGTQRGFGFYSGGGSAPSVRWFFAVTPVAESGSNAGSDILLTAFTDAGATIDNPIAITRAAGGAISVARPLNTTANIVVGGNTGTGNKVFVNSAAGYAREFGILTAGSYRWSLYGNSAAESGSNAGTNLVLGAYTDAGVQIDTPVTIVRAANGSITLARPVYMPKGDLIVGAGDATGVHINLNGGTTALDSYIRWQNNGLARWQYTVTGTEGGSDSGSNWSVSAFNDAGTFIDSPIAVARIATGKVTLARVNTLTAKANSSPTTGDLWYDSTKKTFENRVEGLTVHNQGHCFHQTASKTIANTTTETSLVGTGEGTLTLPANFLTVGRTIKIRARGHVSEVSGPNATLRIKVGSVTIITSVGALPSAGLTTAGWEIAFEFTCRSVGATGTVIGCGNTHVVSGAFVSTVDRDLTMTATATVDTTVANALDITYQWGTASSSNTITSIVASVEVSG
jgi:hypothetical protein